MPGVGCDGAHRLLLRVESIRIAAEILAPEVLFKLELQCSGLPTEARCTFRLTERVEDFRHAHPGVEDVPLELAERLGLPDLTAVGIHDRIRRILPAHVLVTLGRTCSVL